MRYSGSKKRLSKHIIPTMIKHRKPGQYWVEPFVGSGSMICQIDGLRIGNDINEYVISALKAVQAGWIPPTEISKEQYIDIKNNKDKYDKHIVGFVGFACSFGGQWFSSYARCNRGDNYAAQGSRGIVKIISTMRDVHLTHGDYRDMLIPKNSFIYCDPPYKGTTGYSVKFDHDHFWEWCRNKATNGHTVFISEIDAPDDFVCVKSIKQNVEMHPTERSKKRTEKLFVHKSQNIVA